MSCIAMPKAVGGRYTLYAAVGRMLEVSSHKSEGTPWSVRHTAVLPTCCCPT